MYTAALLEDLCTQSVITKKNTGSPIKPHKGLFKLEKKGWYKFSIKN